MEQRLFLHLHSHQHPQEARLHCRNFLEGPFTGTFKGLIQETIKKNYAAIQTGEVGKGSAPTAEVRASSVYQELLQWKRTWCSSCFISFFLGLLCPLPLTWFCPDTGNILWH